LLREQPSAVLANSHITWDKNLDRVDQEMFMSRIFCVTILLFCNAQWDLKSVKNDNEIEKRNRGKTLIVNPHFTN